MGQCMIAPYTGHVEKENCWNMRPSTLYDITVSPNSMGKAVLEKEKASLKQTQNIIKAIQTYMRTS